MLVYNPAIMILDKATSSIDPETEEKLWSSYNLLAEGRTTDTGAHRLSTIRNSDLILVIHEASCFSEELRKSFWQKEGCSANFTNYSSNIRNKH